jgi:hypothetical protein
MAWTQSDIDTLRAAVAAGGAVKSMTFADRTVTFNSIDEMLRLIATMEHSIATAAGTTRTRYASTSKGV